MSLFIAPVVLLVVSGVGDESLHSADETRSIAQMAIDSLATREAQWKEGRMEIVVLQTGRNAMLADLTLKWSGEKIFVDVQKQTSVSLDRSGQLHNTEQSPYRLSTSPTAEWLYMPAISQVAGSGKGMVRGINRDLDVRPARIWATFPLLPELSLARCLQKGLDENLLTSRSIENGLVALDQGSVVYIIDPESDGDIVRLESYMRHEYHPKDGLGEPNCLRATYEWMRDSQGIPFCRELRVDQYLPDELDEPLFTRTLTASTYESKLDKESADFDLDSMEIPKGTLVKYSDSDGSRQWRYEVKGSEAKGLQQPDFDQLIDKVKNKGFARPQKSGGQ